MPRFRIGGPTIKINAAWTAGFGWNVSEGYYGVGSFDSSYSSKAANAPKAEPDAYAFTITPYAGANIELGLSFAGFLQYGFDMFKLQYGMPFDFKIERPISPAGYGYKGPLWHQKSKVEFKFDPGIADFITSKLDRYFGLSSAIGNWDLSISLYRDEKLLRESPHPTLMVECHPSADCFMDPNNGDNADFTVSVADPYWIDAVGKVDLVGWDDPDEVSLELVSSQPFSLNSATGNWQPGVEHEGTWELDGLLWDVDLVSSIFPYITAGTKEAEVGPSYTLSVEKTDQLTGLATDKGKVLSAPEGIDCGEDCEVRFAVDSEVTLTASSSGGFVFVKWADDSDVCPGSEDSECIVIMDSDKAAKAVFEESFNYTVFLAAHLSSSYLEYAEMVEFQAGDSITIYNRMKYHFGLKLDGIPVRVFNFSEDCCEIWPFNNFPTMEYGAMDHSLPGYGFTMRDLTNGRDVTVNVDLTISNEAYRKIAGRTVQMDDQYNQNRVSVTFEHFPEGQQKGELRQDYPDGSTFFGWWDLTGNAGQAAWDTVTCEGGKQTLPVWGVTRNNAKAYGIPGNTKIGPDHLWASSRNHFCPEWAEYRYVFGDH